MSRIYLICISITYLVGDEVITTKKMFVFFRNKSTGDKPIP